MRAVEVEYVGPSGFGGAGIPGDRCEWTDCRFTSTWLVTHIPDSVRGSRPSGAFTCRHCAEDIVEASRA